MTISALRSCSVRRWLSPLQLLHVFGDRIALGLRAALLGSQGLANAGLALAPPGRQQRRVQPFAAEQCSDTAGASGLIGFRQDAVFVLGGEAAALGLRRHV